MIHLRLLFRISQEFLGSAKLSQLCLFNLLLTTGLTSCSVIQSSEARPEKTGERQDQFLSSRQEKEKKGSVSKNMNEETLEESFNQTVTLEGVAQNARLGAIVLLEDYTPVYLDGIEEWDEQIVEKSVAVTGVLRRQSLAPKATVTVQGEASHGIDGESYVLENPEWKTK